MGLRYDEIAAHTGWRETEIQETIKGLSFSKVVKSIGDERPLLIGGAIFENMRSAITQKIDHFQRGNPLMPGITREELRSSIGRRVKPEVFRAVLADLTEQKKLELQGEIVKRAGSGITLQPDEQAAKEKIEAAFRGGGLAVPSVKDVLAGLSVEGKRAEKLLHILLREKSLIRVSPELIFHQVALTQLKERLSAYKTSKGERISVPAFKDLTGITRKYAIPLLEYLDRERVTRRIGDERVIL
jgi:selenocysteine-specific elongation factor